MAGEALGLAASVASLLEISGRIISTGYGYINKVAHAPSRMRMVLSQVTSVDLTLGRLEEYSTSQSTSGKSSILGTLSHNGVFEDCKHILKKVDGTIQLCMSESEAHSSRHEVKALIKRVVWPMREKETEEVLSQLDRLRSVLSDAIAQDSAASLHRLEETTQKLQITTNAIASSQHHAELMAWVCPYQINPSDNYQAALKRRQPGTGEWLTDSDIFRTWSQRDHGIFWLRGLPGSGKTVLTSTVIEQLYHSLVSDENGITLAYFYIDYRDPTKQNLDACLATLVKQLVDQNSRGIQLLEKMNEHKLQSISRNLTSSEYIGIIRNLADLQTKLYIVIDALDEAPDPAAFVNALKQISDRKSGTPIVVLVSSRNESTLESLLMPVVSKHVVTTNTGNDDVRLFINHEVKKKLTAGKRNVPDMALIDLITEKIVSRADGLFLHATLLLKFVFAGKTTRSIKKALTELPNGLEGTYEAILRRITSKNPYHINEIKRSLQWLSMSFMPLTPRMLVEAASIDPDDTCLDPEALMDEADLVGMLSSLVLVDWNDKPPVVSLAHQTVLEYLQSQSVLRSDMSKYYIDARTTHRYLAETSIQYLMFPDSAKTLTQAARFQSPQTVLQSHFHDPFGTALTLANGACFGFELAEYDAYEKTSFLQKHTEVHHGDNDIIIESQLRPNSATQTDADIGPCLTHASQEQALLNYAANLWPEHLKSGRYAISEFNKTMAPKLEWFLDLRQDQRYLYEAWEAFQRSRLSNSLYFVGPFRGSDQQAPLFRQLLKSSYFSYIGHETTQNAFFYTILFGLDNCFNLLCSQYDVDTAFSGGWTTLTVATASGSFSIAEKLLDAGANVNKAADMDERNGLTPLHVAAELAMEDLVKLFLDHDACTSSLTATMTTPFYRAARGGSIKILRWLHDAGSDVNASIWDNYTPLMEAVSWSDVETLDLLLSWGADPHLQNDSGGSAIDLAREMGNEGVASLLMGARSKYTAKAMDTKTVRHKNEMFNKYSTMSKIYRRYRSQD